MWWAHIGIIVLADHPHEANALVGKLDSEYGAVFSCKRTGGMEKRKADGPAIGASEISK